VCYSKKQNSAREAQSSVSDTASRASTANQYQAIEQLAVSTPVYESIPSSSPASSSPPAAAASSPVINATGNESSVYIDTTTTVIDNALYDVKQPPVTSSKVAETDDDVTYLTIINNDLYEREGQGQGQQNAGFTDYECTLIDNDLYR